jgi:Bacterial regulatory helix-turn-helix protein, lysR family
MQDAKVLRLLNVLYTTGSVTRASIALNQSQPTVSIWLARARAQLNDPLFVRTAKGMQPTPRMDGLIGTVREVLAALEKLAPTQTLFNATTSQREFRIYMTDASHITLLPHLFSHVRKIAPGIKLSAASITPGFLGLSGILSSTDLLATLPRQIGETLAQAASLQVLACPIAIPTFQVKQHWHARYHSDGANQWLRGVVAKLFLCHG